MQNIFREYKNKRKIGKDEAIREEKWHFLDQVTRYFVYVCTIEYFIVRWKYIIIINNFYSSYLIHLAGKPEEGDLLWCREDSVLN